MAKAKYVVSTEHRFTLDLSWDEWYAVKIAALCHLDKNPGSAVASVLPEMDRIDALKDNK